jgi:hypothetical protein
MYIIAKIIFMHILAIVCGILQCCRIFFNQGCSIIEAISRSIFGWNSNGSSMREIKQEKEKMQIEKMGGNSIIGFLEAPWVVTTFGVICTHLRGLHANVSDLKSPIKGEGRPPH